MTTLYRASLKQQSDNKYSSNHNSSHNLNLKHRNYSSSKLLKYIQEQQSEKQKITIDQERKIQSSQIIGENNQLKKYCLNKFRMMQKKQKIQPLRKNSSLKIFKKENSFKMMNRSKFDDSLKQKTIHTNQEERISKQSSLGRTISIKRRVELIKKNQNRLKINNKDSQSLKSENKNDISFEEGLQKFIHNQQKHGIPKQKIWSQNLLGEGLKKCSTSKIKILVKNPFQKHMRHQCQIKQQQMQQIKQVQLQQMKQTEQIPIVNQSFASVAHRYQLQQLIAMI